MHIEVVTLFPEMIRAGLAAGVVGRALDVRTDAGRDRGPAIARDGSAPDCG